MFTLKHLLCVAPLCWRVVWLVDDRVSFESANQSIDRSQDLHVGSYSYTTWLFHTGVAVNAVFGPRSMRRSSIQQSAPPLQEKSNANATESSAIHNFSGSKAKSVPADSARRNSTACENTTAGLEPSRTRSTEPFDRLNHSID